MTEDSELLHRFVERGDQEAFAELVRRYVDLVYSAALRQVGGDRHLAADVAQDVFTIVAAKAGTLLEVRSLAGWVYSVTRNRARTHVRSHQRWRKREQEANTMRELLNDDTAASWPQLQAVVDEAMHELRAADRETLLLRYFQNRSLAEIGTGLGLGENAAHMRIERALDQLRVRLEHRGIVSTAAALATALAGQATVTAPAGLATAAVASAIAFAGPGVAATTPAVGTLTLMSSPKLILAGVIAAASVLGVYEWRSRTSVRPAPPSASIRPVQQRPVAPAPSITAPLEPSRPPSEPTTPLDRRADTIRLLAAVNSRESALVILDRVLEGFAENLPPIPDFKVLTADDMAPDMRERFLASTREAAEKSQDLIVIQDPSGRMSYYNFPREKMPVIIPREARPYLTEEDVATFQMRVNVLSIVRTQARRAAEQAPAPAP